MFKDKPILITGADGFIGSHLTESLVYAGYNVRAFVLYNSFNSWGWLDHCGDDVKGKFEVFAGDIRDPHGVWTAMKGCGAVLHLAALVAIPYSYHSPGTYVDTNVKGTLNWTADALIAMSQIKIENDFEIYNVGTGEPTSIGELAQLVCRVANYPAHFVGVDDNPLEKNSQIILDVNKLVKVANWRPGCTLSDGIKKTLDLMVRE